MDDPNNNRTALARVDLDQWLLVSRFATFLGVGTVTSMTMNWHY
jgi:hypothetical protein